MKTPNSVSLIDIENLLKDRNLPRFVLNYLKKIVHEKELNDFLLENSKKFGLELLASGIDLVDAKYKIQKKENFPDEGKYIFVGNHPMGGLEGLLYFHIIGLQFPNVKSLSNDILLNVTNLKELFVPIKVGAKQNREYVRLVDEVYSSDNQILIFPAGLVSRRKMGQIKDLKWKKSFVSKAVQYKRDIVVAHISGRNSNFFYHLANLRHFLGIKTNIEMLYLPDEMLKRRGTETQFIFGKLIKWESLDKRYSHSEWAQLIKEYTYSLTSEPEKSFEDFISFR